MSDELEFSLSAEAVLACLPHISTEESRPILQAIRVEPSGLMVATQGHTLMVWQDAIISSTKPTEPVSLQFIDADARSMVKRLAKNADKKAPMLGITVRRAESGWLLRVDTEMMVCPFAEGPYPDWRQVLPNEASRKQRAERPVSAIGVNPEYVAKFPAQSLTLAFGGDDRAIMVRSANPSWFGLLMPMRIRNEDDGEDRAKMPLWVMNEADRADGAA